MLLNRCNETYACEVSFVDANEIQTIITIFPKALREYFGALDANSVKEKIVTLSNADIKYNQQSVAVKVISHDGSGARMVTLSNTNIEYDERNVVTK